MHKTVNHNFLVKSASEPERHVLQRIANYTYIIEECLKEKIPPKIKEKIVRLLLYGYNMPDYDNDYYKTPSIEDAKICELSSYIHSLNYYCYWMLEPHDENIIRLREKLYEEGRYDDLAKCEDPYSY